MRYTVLVLMALLLASITTVGAQNSQDFASLVTKTQDSEFDIKGAVKIDRKRAFELNQQGVTFVDVRRAIQHQTGHIPGAISLELKSMLTPENLAKHIAKDQMVVFYCSDRQCYRSAHASAKAISWGYTNVLYYADGWSGWLAAGYPRG